MNAYPVSRGKNALKTAFKTMYLLELGMQVLEWRITVPKSNTKSASENKLSFSGNNLLALYRRGNLIDTADNESLLSSPKVKLNWTGNKVDLVELI